VHSKARIGLV